MSGLPMILDSSGKQLAGTEAEAPARMVEVVRSFSYKLNMGTDENGRPTYESCDLFCSKKEQCAPEDVAEVSRDIHEFCVEEVMEGIREIKERIAKKRAAKAARSNAA